VEAVSAYPEMARDMVPELDGARTGRVAARAHDEATSGQLLQAIDEQPKIRLIHSHRTSVRSSEGALRPANGIPSIGPLAAAIDKQGQNRRQSRRAHVSDITRRARPA